MCVMCARARVCVCATELASQLLIRVRALVRQQQPFVSPRKLLRAIVKAGDILRSHWLIVAVSIIVQPLTDCSSQHFIASVSRSETGAPRISRKMLPMLRLIVSLLLLLFTLTVLGEEDPATAAAVKEKDVNEDSSKPSEGAKRASDPNNPWTRMPDWHFAAPYLYHGFYPLHPLSATFPGVPQQPLSPLMSMMFPAHMAQSGHPWGVAPHHWPQVTYPYPVPVHPVTPLMGAMFPAHTAPVWHPWEGPHYHAPYPAYPGYPIHSDDFHHFHQHTMSPLMSMMMHAHPVEAHPWGAPVYDVHFPAVPASPTPGQAFRWRYPEHYYPYHYGYFHGPLHTSATFYPHKPQGGYCNFDQTFLCWGMAYCIQPKAMCDGVYDCPNHFDELPHLCIEGRRPSVESITQFLGEQGWIKSDVFGVTGKTDSAIAEVLKSAASVEELRWKLGLDEEHVNNTRDALQAAMNNDSKTLEDLNMPTANFETVKYFFKTLLDTGLRTST